MNSINHKLIEKTIDKLNEVMNDLTGEEQYSLREICLALKNTSDKEEDLELKQSLLILSDICSPILNLESRNDPFKLLITIAKNNTRTFLPIDLNEDKLNYLSLVIHRINYPIIKSRIADILWTYLKPRKIDHAEIAIRNYININVCNDFFEFGIYDSWKRATFLAKQIKNNNILKEVKLKLINEINNNQLNNYSLHLLNIADICYSTNLDENLNKKLAKELLNKQQKFNHEAEFSMVEDYLKLASKLFQDEDKKYECIALLAHATENHGDYQKKRTWCNKC